jgi:Nif-specific regulatory protein
MAGERNDLEQITRERDFYLRLLDLDARTEPETFLPDALSLMVDVAGARHGYLEMYDPDDPDGNRKWSLAHGFSPQEVDGVRLAISRGIIAQALATGQTIVTPSAVLDPRFMNRESVQIAQIGAVLCAPIGCDTPRGVLCLQGREAGGFDDKAQRNAELFANHLAPFVERLLARRRRREDEDHTRAIRDTIRLNGVIGRSAALAAVLRQIALVAPLDVTVLLTGASGTGKSQLARILHENGPRAGGPVIEINCAALPEALVESELFGALPGAHSTATRRMEGKVTAASGGTLILDEVGELPLTIQAKLLQFLQSREYYPLGSSKPLRADVRIIAATNADLHAAVAERRFREDLFYRLQILPLRVPALSERRADIPELAAYFCAGASERYGLPRLELSPAALRALEGMEWPGNIRQLAHAVEAAVIRAAGEGAEYVQHSHIVPNAPADAQSAVTFQEATRRFQAEFLRDALEKRGWNVVEVAKDLDVARSHLYSLIRAFGLVRPK